MQTKYKNGKWNITTSKTEMDKLDSLLGWLKPLTELSTPMMEDALAATESLEAIKEYLVQTANPTTPEN